MAEGRLLGLTPQDIAAVATVDELAGLLRQLRRRDARRRGDSELTDRELAAKTGWSPGIVAQYLTGVTLAPTDRFDVLARLLGASPAEQGALATARDRVDERRRRPPRARHPTGPVPRQLPADVAGFTGRAEPLADLDALLDTGPVCVLSGTAGVGKTTLAVHWAHRTADRFPDGQLYVDLRGFHPNGPAMDPAEAVRGFLTANDVPPHRIPAGIDAQAALYRSLLAGRRMLVVLDNARDAEQVRPLLPGSPGCRTLVTSRNRLPGLVASGGAHPLGLDLPSAGEARQLLASRIGDRHGPAEPDAVDEIVRLCARLPLAMAIVAARVATSPGVALGRVAGELRDTLGGPAAFADGDTATDVRGVFSWSYRVLGDDAGRLFRLLGLHPGPDVSPAAAASLAGVPPERARALLAELAGAHLLTEDADGRYGFHDLLRAYAAELAGNDQDAVRRLLDHYLHTAGVADRLLYPHRDPLVLDAAAPGVTPEAMTGHAPALAWFTAEHPVLLGAIRLAADAGFDAHAWRIAWTLTTYLDRRGHWHDQAAAQTAALAAAVRVSDVDGRARSHRNLGWAYAQLGRHTDAERHLRRALDLYATTGDRTGQAHTHLDLGFVADRLDRRGEALGHAELAVTLFTEAGHRYGLANALDNVGRYHGLSGDHHQALAACERANAVHTELGNRAGQAATWDSLGRAHHQLGHAAEAITCYRRSIELNAELGDRYHQASTLVHLGDAYLAIGDPAAARAVWEHSAGILDELAHPDLAAVHERLAANSDIPRPH